MNEGQPVTSGDNGANFTCLVENPAIQARVAFVLIIVCFYMCICICVYICFTSSVVLLLILNLQGRNISRKFNLNVLCKFRPIVNYDFSQAHKNILVQQFCAILTFMIVQTLLSLKARRSSMRWLRGRVCGWR